METSHKEICWGLVLVIGTKSLADLSLASVAQGRIISRKGGYARAEELIRQPARGLTESQMDRLVQTDGLREHSGSKKGRPTS